MKPILPEPALARYTARQLSHFFPDDTPVADLEHAVQRGLPQVLARLARIAAVTRPPMFHRGDEVIFDHLFSDQYAMYLYLLSHELGVHLGEREVATKLYLLNKALHGLEAYFEIKMPDIFLFLHPVGTVLGRAVYGDRFVVLQGCTVGNIRNVFPTLGAEVMLCAGSSVLGDAHLGDGVTVGAGTLIVGKRIPAGTTVVGRAEGLVFRNSGRPPMARRFFI